jgi:hypothetical protein
MAEIAEKLTDWIAKNESFQKRNPMQWEDLLSGLFPDGLPTRAIWDRREEVITVIRKIAGVKTLGHIFFPTGGGLNLDYVGDSYEEECIEFSGGGWIYIAKSKRLIFESFGTDPTWDCFRLETAHLEPMGQYDFDFRSRQEPLTEISKSLYTYRDCLEFDDFDGDRLPDTARPIVRILGGDFVIFATISPYTQDPNTYDGRHNTVTADEFRDYIKKHAAGPDTPSPAKGRSETRFLIPQKRRKSARALSPNETALLKNIIRMAEDRDTEDAELRERYGLHPTLTNFHDENLSQYMLAPRPKEVRLRRFLEQCSSENLILVAAVMYGGLDSIFQGRVRPLEEMIEEHRGIHVSILIHYRAGRIPLSC